MTRSILSAALALAVLAGCSSDHSTRSGVGTVHMYLTDAPAAIDAVNLDVVGVQIHRSSPDTVSGWETLPVDSAVVNLLSLTNGVLRSVTTGTVPAGSYDQVRLLLGPHSTVVVDGTTFPLTVPSGQQTGLKIVGGFTVPDGGTIELALDFDAARSVHETGSGTWMLDPVVRIVQLASQAKIIGIVGPVGSALHVYAIGTAADTVQTAVPVGGTGSFVLAGLPGGTFNVAVQAAPGFRDTTIAGVVVATGATRDLGTITLQSATQSLP